MKTIGIGMIGYGFMGKVHTYGYRSIPLLYEPAPANIRLVGVAVRSEASAKLAVEQAGYEFSTPDYKELLKRDDIDAVSICTPNNVHKDMVIDAIRAGKHIYIDKPLAMNAEQAREIIAAEAEAEAAGIHRTRQMVQNYRFIPALMRAKQLMDEGRLGQIFTFNFRYLHNSNTDPSRPFYWKQSKAVGGGGSLVDLGAHIIDLGRWLMGEFEKVNAMPATLIPERPDGKGGTAKVDTDDVTFFMAQMKNGGIGTFEASKLAMGANDEIIVEIRGSKGALKFNMMDPNWLDFFDNERPGDPIGGEKGYIRIECVQRYPKPAALPGPKFSVGWMRFHIASAYEFIRRVAENEPGNPSLSEGLAAHRVIDACYKAPGTWVEV